MHGSKAVGIIILGIDFWIFLVFIAEVRKLEGAEVKNISRALWFAFVTSIVGVLLIS